MSTTIKHIDGDNLGPEPEPELFGTLSWAGLAARNAGANLR
jgi:hypothetical protein